MCLFNEIEDMTSLMSFMLSSMSKAEYGYVLLLDAAFIERERSDDIDMKKVCLLASGQHVNQGSGNGPSQKGFPFKPGTS